MLSLFRSYPHTMHRFQCLELKKYLLVSIYLYWFIIMWAGAKKRSRCSFVITYLLWSNSIRCCLWNLLAALGTIHCSCTWKWATPFRFRQVFTFSKKVSQKSIFFSVCLCSELSLVLLLVWTVEMGSILKQISPCLCKIVFYLPPVTKCMSSRHLEKFGLSKSWTSRHHSALQHMRTALSTSTARRGKVKWGDNNNYIYLLFHI